MTELRISDDLAEAASESPRRDLRADAEAAFHRVTRGDGTYPPPEDFIAGYEASVRSRSRAAVLREAAEIIAVNMSKPNASFNDERAFVILTQLAALEERALATKPDFKGGRE